MPKMKLSKLAGLIVPAFIIAVVALTRLEVITSTAAAIALGLVEVAAVSFLIWRFFTVRRAYRAGRQTGLRPAEAVEDALDSILPGMLARLVFVELRLWASLGLWLSRRSPRSDSHFAGDRRSILGPVVAIAFITGIAEAAALHFLLPWEWLRIVALVLNIYALVWVAAIYAGMKVRLHHVAEDALYLRLGLFASVRIPYSLIYSIAAESVRSPRGSDGLHVDKPSAEAWLASGSRSDVTVKLSEPLQLEGFIRRTSPVSIIHVAVDDVSSFTQAVSARIG